MSELAINKEWEDREEEVAGIARRIAYGDHAWEKDHFYLQEDIERALEKYTHDLRAEVTRLRQENAGLVAALKNIKKHQETAVNGPGVMMSTTWRIADDALTTHKDNQKGGPHGA